MADCVQPSKGVSIPDAQGWNSTFFIAPFAPFAGKSISFRGLACVVALKALVPKTLVWLAASALCLSVPPILFAQLPIARLSAVFPPGGRAGTTVEVSLTGADLDDVTQLLFSHSNIISKPKLIEATGQADPNRFTIGIGADVPSGVYESRAAGRFGVSNPRAFVVDDLPEVNSPTTNHTTASAFEVAPGTVVNGRADPSAVDYFRFAAKKGQRILLECLAQEIDSRMDEAMVVCDNNGKELDRSGRGNLLDFTAPADGQYILKVHDFTYRGGDEYFYRLTVGTGPHIDYILPPSGVAGTKSRFDLYGRNLPGGMPSTNLFADGKPLERLTVEIEMPDDSTIAVASAGVSPGPASSVLGLIEYRLRTPQGTSNPLLLSLATAPVVSEQEPNSEPGEAQRITLPCEIAGQFHPAGDQDWFAFDAKAGDVYWIEIFSARLGLPTDPFLLVQRVVKNDKGEETTSILQELYDSEANVGGPEFNTSSRDPSWRFEVKESGLYRIQVRDLFGRVKSSPRHVYRLSLRKESPDFRLVALPQPPPPVNKDAKEAQLWMPFLRRGETMPIKVLALRRDNFNGAISLSVEGLPKGVTCAPVAIETNQNSKLLLFTASEDAEGWFGPITIVGHGKIGDSPVSRSARAATIKWTVPDYNNEAIHSRLTRNLFLAVSGAESAPFTVEPAENKAWEADAGARLHVPLKVIRRGDFNESLKLKAVGVTALDSLKELDVDSKTNAAVLEIDLSQQKLPPGAHTLYLQTQTKGKYRNNPEAAKAAEEAVKDAEKRVAESPAEARKAEEALATATKAAEEAESEARAAAEKLALAKAAAEQTPASEELISARDTAEGEAAVGAEKARQATESKGAAARAVEDAAARAKDAEAKKAEAIERAKKANEKAQPREVTITVYSTPITVAVKPEEKKP